MPAPRTPAPLCPTSEAGRERLLSLTGRDLAALRNRTGMRLHRILSSPNFAGACLVAWALGMTYLTGWPGAIPDGAGFTSLAGVLGVGAMAAFVLVGAALHNRFDDEAYKLQPLHRHTALCDEMLAAVREVAACQRYRDRLIGTKRELLVADAQAVLAIASAWRTDRQREKAQATWQALTSPPAGA